MKYILTIFFIATFFCASAQIKNTSGKPMTAQDSVNFFIDSLASNVTIKEFLSWADDGVSGKMFRESPFSSLWSIFIQNKYNEWMQKKAKPKQ